MECWLLTITSSTRRKIKKKVQSSSRVSPENSSRVITPSLFLSSVSNICSTRRAWSSSILSVIKAPSSLSLSICLSKYPRTCKKESFQLFHRIEWHDTWWRPIVHEEACKTVANVGGFRTRQTSWFISFLCTTLLVRPFGTRIGTWKIIIWKIKQKQIVPSPRPRREKEPIFQIPSKKKKMKYCTQLSPHLRFLSWIKCVRTWRT